METTLTAVPIKRAPAPADRARRELALVLLWSREQPERVGEVAILTPTADARPYVLGRGGGRPDLHRVAWVRQRPGRNTPTGALASPRISRDQLLVQLLADRRLALTNVGKLGLRIRGEAHSGGVAGPGELLELDDEVLMMVTERPRALPPLSREDEVSHSFGAADRDGVVGESVACWELRERIAFAAGRAVHVLIRGESGTGKELVAQAIHARSPRARRPMCARNAATIPETLIDAELFGNAKNFPQSGMPERPGLIGQADGSTLFLDEFAELPQAMQAHLLRVLDQGEYQRLGEARARRADLRLVAATNRPEAALKHDILARLPLRVELPGLNARREDVPLLARHLIERIIAADPAMARRVPRDGRGPALSQRLVAALVTRRYTTHVRELEGLLWQALSRARGGLLDVWEDLPMRWSADPGATSEAPARDGDDAPARGGEDATARGGDDAPASGDDALASGEEEAPASGEEEAPGVDAVDPMSLGPEELQACLDRHDGQQEPAWRELGLASRHVLARLVKRYGLRVRGRGGRRRSAARDRGGGGAP
ncbi:MAG: sigma-54-dependent Fis family transcriptional regulator [Myxococcales bacterium]|nr:sigma-54-dependent Fis family transcriptional regulator [Myxococcales bacterium]